MRKQSFVFERWPRLAYRHPRSVLASVVGFLLALVLLWSTFGGDFSDTFSIPGSESQDLYALLGERFPQTRGDPAYVVVKADGRVQDEPASSQIQTLVADITRLPHVSEVVSPFETENAISQDGTIARIDVTYDERARSIDSSTANALLDVRDHHDSAGFQVEAGGPVVDASEEEPPGSAELIGISAAAVILLIAFGSVVAMGLPILVALLGLGSGFFVVGIMASVGDLPDFTAQFTAMIGIGVGIDYALLITNRFREAVARGASAEDATVIASATAGRSVFFAGGTVMIALLGLWASGITNIGWVGTAAATVVGMTVIVALFALPAILHYAGPMLDRWRIPFLAAPAADARTSLGYRLSRIVQRRPLVCLVLSMSVLLLLTMPVLDLRLGTSDAGNNPESFTSRRAYDLISEGFGPGTNGPILVGVRIDDPSALPAVEGTPQSLAKLEGVDRVSGVRFNEERTAAVMRVVPASAPQDQKTVDLVHRLRRVLKADYGGVQAEPLVGGSTAASIDVGDHLAARLPWFLGAVILLSFLLLMAVFRSILVPLKAALMNLISMGASFGILVAIFQWGWFGEIVGVDHGGPVEVFLPMMLFAVLFGLSMDYEVFLVSRIREEYVHSGDNTESVARGLSVTTRVITAAAAIMVAVFMAFAFSDQRVIKEFGIGLATAIFLDATIVRLILVPSLMQLAGKWNWWLPAWLDRLIPHINVEGRGLAGRAPAPLPD
jgi:RND superfamily putative drug exporter